MQEKDYFESGPIILNQRGQPFIHRDLSWLQFNERVLQEADNPENPLLERLKFLSISASNLDEFTMIRLASLRRAASSQAVPHLTKIADSNARIFSNVAEGIQQFERRQMKVISRLTADLHSNRVDLPDVNTLTGDQRVHCKDIFKNEILPNLGQIERATPKRLSRLANLQLAALWEDGQFLPIPIDLPSIFIKRVDDAEGKPQHVQVYYLDQILIQNLSSLTEKNKSPCIIKVIRDGDLTLQSAHEFSSDFIEELTKKLHGRQRGKFVRLQVNGKLRKEAFKNVQRAFHTQKEDFGRNLGSLCLNGLLGSIQKITEILAPTDKKLIYPKFTAQFPPWFYTGTNVYHTLDKRDLLLHHPYDTFGAFVDWLEQAATDPDVISIEQTLYRTDRNSALLQALKHAARTKTVRVVLELRARFDELNNTEIAKDLGENGVQVTFASDALKLHAKMTLITKKTKLGMLKHYVHLSTGNYKETTSRQYEDLAILTSDPIVGQDVRKFFDSIYDSRTKQGFKKILLAPTDLHSELLRLIDDEINASKKDRTGQIFVKVNALVDPSIIQKLYSASKAGVRIDLMVRGACSLVPGVSGISENIRVFSIVDRFLEHSRIFYFKNSHVIYLSSADWMPRNFFSRKEIAFPVLDHSIFKFIEEGIVPIYLSDRMRARELNSKGVWKMRNHSKNGKVNRAQAIFLALASAGYPGYEYLTENSNPSP